MDEIRFDRNIRFFGKEGQSRLTAMKVTIVGIGGLGTHIVQQLALLGVASLNLIDNEELDETNRNRYVGALWTDPIPGTLKVDIGKRIVDGINPAITVNKIPSSLLSKEAFDSIINADIVFGCLDNEGMRLVLNELCAAYSKPYIDCASEIIPGPPLTYGGRICIAWKRPGCIYCHNEIDIAEAQIDLLDPDAQKNRKAIYGILPEELNKVGPSVVSINGIIASVAVTEFMVGITGIRNPRQVLTYRGNMGIISAKNEEPAPDCYYCGEIIGKGDKAGVHKYFK